MAQADSVCNATRALITGAAGTAPNDPARAVHAELVRALAGHPPWPIPLFPHPTHLEDRAEHLKRVLKALSVYVTAMLADAAQNVPGGVDHRSVAALLSDLTSEVSGILQKAADDTARRVA